MSTPTFSPHSPRQPQGQPTRGKTARNRLRRVDIFALRYDPHLIRRTDGAFAAARVVDLGYGAEPYTTLEMAARLRRLNSGLPCLGVEIDPQRVAAAMPYTDALTEFRRGGFNVPLLPGETVRLIRAFNVLRQYGEDAVAEAWWRMGQSVLPGGLLIEGTSDPLGRIWVANVLRRTTDDDQHWDHECLVFSTNFRAGFDPADFQAVLPKNLIHHMVDGAPIYDFFNTWKQAALSASAYRVWGPRRWFVATARALADAGFPVVCGAGWWRRGYLLVRIGR